MVAFLLLVFTNENIILHPGVSGLDKNKFI